MAATAYGTDEWDNEYNEWYVGWYVLVMSPLPAVWLFEPDRGT
jgi:hypothetical protein